MPIPWAPILIGAGTAGANALFGGGDRMSPEEQELYRILRGKLGVAQNVQGQIDATKQNFTQQAADASASMENSAARRGMPLNLGQQNLAQADIQGSYGKALATAIPQIQRNAKNEEMGILSQMIGMAPRPEGAGNLLESLGQFGQNLSYYMNRPKEDSMNFNFSMPDSTSGGLWNPIGYNSVQPHWRKNPYTGQWEQVNG